MIKASGCGRCRLPDEPWIGVHMGLGMLGVSLMVGALWRRQYGAVAGIPEGGGASAPATTEAGNRLESATAAARTAVDERSALHLRRTFVFLAGAAVLVEIGASVIRLFADLGRHGGLDRWASVLDVMALVLLGLFVVVELSAAGRGGAVAKLRTFIQRYRVNVVGVSLLVVVVDLVADTSGQAIDSVRTWVLWDRTHMAHLGFGLATTIVLALVVYESSLRLAHTHARLPRGRKTEKALVPEGQKRWWWWCTTATVLIVGGVLRWKFSFGWGLVIFGGLLLVLGLLELPLIGTVQAEPADPGGKAATSAAKKTHGAVGEAGEPDPGSGSPEILAAVPLLAIAAIAIAGAIDAMLDDAPAFRWSSLAIAFPALLLAVVAVAMTGDGRPMSLPSLPGPKGWTVAALVAAVLFILVAIHSERAAAVASFVLLAASVSYAVLLFYPRSGRFRENRDSFVVLPVAILGAFVALVAVHWDVYGVGRALGIFGLVNVALAGVLAGLYWLVAWSMQRRPPRLLALIGFQQLPILSLIAVWWILAGLTAPAELHDVQLTRRTHVSPPSTLAAAFQMWVQDQAGALRAPQQNGPLPLVLVAAHGGGIRSAYWTALALDCIVGATAQPPTAEESAYDAACGHRRNPAQTGAAAKRIFLISSVSGGAVGIYAYARELLAEGRLPQGWVLSRLGGDFAAPTIGWGLFHDLPNHLIGLHPSSGGRCDAALNSQCFAADRASVLDDTFDRAWRPPTPDLRGIWDARASNTQAGVRARLVPLLIFNSTVVGGIARAVTSPIPLSDWPLPETSDLSGSNTVDNHPLAGTPQVLAALCAHNDLRLSTAALLAGRFPYVSPAGRISGNCAPNKDTNTTADGACTATHHPVGTAGCQMELIDGGYIDNSGLATVDTILPTVKQLIELHNAAHSKQRRIALVVVELDNYYRAAASEAPSADSTVGQTLAPPITALGGRQSVETFARADAYRLTPANCTITISPAQHPGLHAPVGWEISPSAERELQNGLVRQRYSDPNGIPPLTLITRLQDWLSGSQNAPPLSDCVPNG